MLRAFFHTCIGMGVYRRKGCLQVLLFIFTYLYFNPPWNPIAFFNWMRGWTTLDEIISALDQISTELLKHHGKAAICKTSKLLNNCWQNECILDNWRNGIIIKIPQKGNLSYYNDWRDITLLSVPGKVLCTVPLKGLQSKIKQYMHEEQDKFRQGHSCGEQIFSFWNIIE